MGQSDVGFHSNGEPLINRITSAATLIVLGIFFLLNTMGIIPWSSWGTVLLIFLRIWPVFIIIGGFQIIFGKNSLLSSIFGIISSLVFVFVLMFAAYLNTSNNALKQDLEKNIPFLQTFNIDLDKGEYVTSDYSVSKDQYDLKDISQREVTMSFTSEEYSITTNEDSLDYLDLNASYYKNSSSPFLTSKLEGNKLVIDSGVENKDSIKFLFFNQNSDYKYVLGQTQIPTALNIKMTSGNGVLDLKDLNLDSLTIEETSGNMDVDLSKTNVKAVNVQLTSGNNNLELPKDSLINITYNKTSGNLTVNNKDVDSKNGVVQIGDLNSENVIDVNIQLTSGNVVVTTL